MYLRRVLTIFAGNRSVVLLFLPIIVGIYAALNWFFPHHLPEGNAQFGFWGELISEKSIISQILAPTAVLMGGVLLNAAFNSHAFFERNNYLPSLLYVLFMSFFHGFYFLNGMSIAALFIILCLRQLYGLEQNTDGRKRVFNAAFLLGVSATVYPMTLVAIPFLFWLMWVIRPFLLRESALALIGFLLPLVYAGIYSNFYQLRLDGSELSSSSWEQFYPDLWVIGGAAILLVFASFGGFIAKWRQSSIRLKKLFRMNVLLAFMLLSILALEILFFLKVDPACLLSIPLITLLPYSFGEKQPHLFASGVFYLALLFSVGKFFVDFSI